MAPGMPRATRRSQFNDLTAMGRLTVAVAEYACEQTAYSAFTDLVQDLRYTPGSVGLGRPDVGHDALATLIRSLAVPKGMTVAAREQRLIVQVSSTGFRYSRDHLDRLVRLAEHQMSTAVSAGGHPNESRPSPMATLAEAGGGTCCGMTTRRARSRPAPGSVLICIVDSRTRWNGAPWREATHTRRGADG